MFGENRGARCSLDESQAQDEYLFLSVARKSIVSQSAEQGIRCAMNDNSKAAGGNLEHLIRAASKQSGGL